jgi:cobalt-zinc-cadmium efflux system outer membrane protein
MRWARASTIVTVVAACTAVANAQDVDGPSPPPLTLARALELAHQFSPELAAARDAVAAAAARSRQASAFSNPTLSFDREQTSHAGQTSAQSIVALDQPFDIAGLRSARASAARLRVARAQAELDAAESQLVFEVTRTYALAVAADRQALLAESAAAAFERAQTVSETRLAAGDVSGYAIRRIRLEAARYAVLLASAQLEQRAAYRALVTYLDSTGHSRPPRSLILADSMAATLPDLPTDTLHALALRHRAELRAAALRAETATADARVASRERYPMPVVSAGMKSERLDGGDSQSGFVAGVSLPLPLWDRRGGAIDAALAEARRETAEAERVRRRVLREVDDAVESVRATHRQLAMLRPQLGAEASAALHAAQIAYAEGEITLVEWLDAVRAYQETESMFASLSAEWRIQLAALERAVGTPLSRNAQ